MVRRGIVCCVVKEDFVLAVCITESLLIFLLRLASSTDVITPLTDMHVDNAQFHVPEKFVYLLVE
jgi:hypothetical protein